MSEWNKLYKLLWVLKKSSNALYKKRSTYHLQASALLVLIPRGWLPQEGYLHQIKHVDHQDFHTGSATASVHREAKGFY